MNKKEAIQKITDFAGTNFFITKKISLKDVYEQLISFYDIFLYQFKTVFALLEELADLYYFDFANKIGGRSSLTGNESFLREARKVVLGEACICTDENFLKFVSLCTRNIYGYLKYQGKLVTRIMDDKKMILHENGLWVGIDHHGSFVTLKVTENDFPKGEMMNEF